MTTESFDDENCQDDRELQERRAEEDAEEDDELRRAFVDDLVTRQSAEVVKFVRSGTPARQAQYAELFTIITSAGRPGLVMLTPYGLLTYEDACLLAAFGKN